MDITRWNRFPHYSSWVSVWGRTNCEVPNANGRRGTILLAWRPTRTPSTAGRPNLNTWSSKSELRETTWFKVAQSHSTAGWTGTTPLELRKTPPKLPSEEDAFPLGSWNDFYHPRSGCQPGLQPLDLNRHKPDVDKLL